MTDVERAVACLEQLAPVRCEGYADWLAVGMALHHAGAPCSAWDAWSQQSAKYRPGECERKWRGFGRGGMGAPVTLATLLDMVVKDGGRIPRDPETGFGWDEPIPAYYQGADAKNAPRGGEDEAGDDPLAKYLEALFHPEEIVGYCVDSWQPPETVAWKPRGKGVYVRTAAEIAAVARAQGAAEAVLYGGGEGGGWIRVNPLDGKGIADTNVVEFRHVLVESDAVGCDEQLATIRRLRLPCAAIVHSGGKSIHAVVRVDAGRNFDEYRKRVDYLYGILAEAGLPVDRQNRNPSRLSRLPGIMRGERLQALIGVNEGCKSWQEWWDYQQGIHDDLPDIEGLPPLVENPPPLAPELIQGVLRQGHKLLLSGPSKAGKSFALIQLVLAIAEGRRWIGWDCAAGRVLYCNLELDRASCIHRFLAVHNALGEGAPAWGNIDVWNLRGRSCPLDEFAPKLLRRIQGTHYACVVIDPIYKLLTGDENSASDMAYFCNQLDKISVQAQTAVVVASHFAKGDASAKRSMDRTSGSGVFARDPDAIMTMTELATESETPAFRLEFTLREFPAPRGAACWFRYPIHVLDDSGELAAAKEQGAPNARGGGRPKSGTGSDDLLRAVRTAKAQAKGGPVTRQGVAEVLGVSVETLKRRCRECGFGDFSGLLGWYEGETNDSMENV